MIVSIREFAISGRFGPVSIGMSREQVTEELGQPDGKMNLSRPCTGIHYSMYEFFFDEGGRLKAIQNDHCDPEHPDSVEYKGDRFQVDPRVLRSTPRHTLASVQEVLKREGVPHTLVEYFGRTVIQLPSKVILDFDDEQNDRSIIGIRCLPEHENAWP